MTPGKGGDDKDSPLHFSIKDWPTFKEAIQSHADARDPTWLLEAGRALALFSPRQIKDKTGSGATRKKALELENVKTDSNHVPTSVDAYTVGALKEWFDDMDLATDLQLSLNKNRFGVNGVKFLRPHQVGVQRCRCAGEGTQGRR